jgi:hypothetical protein
MSTISLFLATVFGLAGLLKWYTTVGAVRWLRRCGREYRQKLQGCSPHALNGAKIRELVDACGGRSVLPWGVLEYNLFRRSRSWQFFGRNLYRLPPLPALALLSYFVFGFHGSRLEYIAWSVVALTYQIVLILLAFEAVYAYIAIGGYRRYYHVGIRLSDNETPNVADDMYELDIFLPLGLSAMTINVLAVMVARVGWHSFISSQVPFDDSQRWALLLQCIYFVSTTMTTIGFGDILPSNLWGQVVTTLMQLHTLLLLVGLFSTMMSFGLRGVGQGSDNGSDLITKSG